MRQSYFLAYFCLFADPILMVYLLIIPSSWKKVNQVKDNDKFTILQEIRYKK